MEVKKASHENLSEIVEFQVQMAAETENLNLNRETVSAGVQKIFNNQNLGTYWGVYEKEKLIACTLTVPEFSEWRNGTVLWIHSVYVIEEYRGKGVFKKIYNSLKNLVIRDSDYMGLRLYVDKSNHNAQEVYRKLGMDGEHYLVYEWMKKSKNTH
mgnify:CR=1 FL=1